MGMEWGEGGGEDKDSQMGFRKITMCENRSHMGTEGIQEASVPSSQFFGEH